MLEIFPLKALNDNYIWVLSYKDNNTASIVDPGEAKPVIDYLTQNAIKLSAILITHHHWDHTSGVAELVAKYNVPVFGPTGQTVVEGEIIDLVDQKLQLKAMHIPGHTLDHVAYYNDKILFTGDTLFAAGCGRVFEGTYEQMYTSLQKIKQLPKQLQVYCGHEYTVKNLRFAATIEPNNSTIQKRMANCADLQAQNLPTLPTTLDLELATNPFLRAKDVDNFTKLRKQKDIY